MPPPQKIFGFFCVEIMHFGALLAWAYLPLLKRIRSFYHTAVMLSDITDGSAAGHSDFICGSARTLLLYASINQPELPKVIVDIPAIARLWL